MQDIQKIEGTIICNVDSASNEEISLVISNLKETILNGLILDLDGSVENSLMTGNKSLKIDYIIPNHKEFRVCHYSFPSIEQPPILGSYQKKQLSENCFRIRIKIDVEKNYRRLVKNLKIQLRLDPYKAISSTDLLANEGKVDIIGNRVLLWTITGRLIIEIFLIMLGLFDVEEDLCLSGNLHLKQNEQWKGQEKINISHYLADLKQTNGLNFSCLTEDDILFYMPEKFLEIEFEMADYLVSGMQITPNSVSIFPTRKLDTVIEKYTRSKKYFIFLDEDWDTEDFTHLIYPKITKSV